jgi:uncharacterized protein (TIRG00374 family)
VKWRLLLRAQGATAELPSLIAWYLAGTFAGTFLPSDVGGDLGRGYLAARHIPNKTVVWSSIVVERLSGLAALILLAAVTLAFAPSMLSWNPIAPLIGAVGMISLALAAWAALAAAAKLSWLPEKLKAPLASAHTALVMYMRRPGVLLASLALSLLFHLLSIVSLWCVLLALQPDTPLHVAFIWPLVGLVGLVPLTPGGLGVRDGVQAVLLVQAGVESDVAFAAALLTRGLLWLVALSGLPVMLQEVARRRIWPLAANRDISSDEHLASASSCTKR